LLLLSARTPRKAIIKLYINYARGSGFRRRAGDLDHDAG